jgi:hypothetical protein
MDLPARANDSSTKDLPLRTHVLLVPLQQV